MNGKITSKFHCTYCHETWLSRKKYWKLPTECPECGRLIQLYNVNHKIGFIDRLCYRVDKRI